MDVFLKVLCVILLVQKLMTQVLSDDVCKRHHDDGFVRRTQICQKGYDSQMTEGGVMCCLPCKQPCTQEGYARVDDKNRNTPSGRCFGTCTKCSDITTPVHHYKNATTQSCQQCTNCQHLRLSTVTQCGDTYNTRCGPFETLTHIVTSTPTSIVTSTPTSQNNSHDAGQLLSVAPASQSSETSIFTIIGAVTLVCIFVVISAFSLKKSCYDGRNRAETDIEKGGCVESTELLEARNEVCSEDNANNEEMEGCSTRSSGCNHSNEGSKDQTENEEQRGPSGECPDKNILCSNQEVGSDDTDLVKNSGERSNTYKKHSTRETCGNIKTLGNNSKSKTNTHKVETARHKYKVTKILQDISNNSSDSLKSIEFWFRGQTRQKRPPKLNTEETGKN